MRYQKRKKAGWRIAVAIIAIMTVLSCGLLIALDVRKVAAEKRFERKFARGKAMTKAAPTFPPPAEPDKK
jgi:hypothetical protein